MKKRRLVAFIALFLFVSVGIALSMPRQSRLSAAVAFIPESPELLSFLKKPGLTYAQGYLRFPAAMADDVIMFLDIEMIEGLFSFEEQSFARSGQKVGAANATLADQ